MSGQPGRPPRRRLVRRRPGYLGTIGAVSFFALAQTPSLLPRSWLLQGALAGLTAAIGYGLATAAEALTRPIRRRRTDARPGRRSWLLLLGSGVTVVTLSLLMGWLWQRQARELVGLPPLQGWHPAGILLVAAAVAAVLVMTARGVRLAARTAGRWLARFVPDRIAYGAGGLLLGFVVAGAVHGFLFEGVVDGVNRAASVADMGTPPGVEQPTSTTRSGAPASRVRWSTLGYQGRAFTAGGPSVEQLQAFTRAPAVEPVRAYVGLASADSVEDRVDLALDELDRTGAWNRSVLVVVGTTGTGWVNPLAAASLEYLRGGDTAVVAMQYSYLPSWVSVLADQGRTARTAGLLVDAVRQRWQQLPADTRPRLILYGESLGSYGIESAFADLDELADSMDGALLVGPTNANPLWRQAVRERDRSSPVWRPRLDGGRRVLFVEAPADLALPDRPTARPRVIYLQNSSDPVVWWTPRLLWRRPQWLDSPRGPDVPTATRWVPLVTFWQVTLDLVFATRVPVGHGHRYGAEIVDAWTALAAPPDWSAGDSARLRAVTRSP